MIRPVHGPEQIITVMLITFQTLLLHGEKKSVTKESGWIPDGLEQVHEAYVSQSWSSGHYISFTLL